MRSFLEFVKDEIKVLSKEDQEILLADAEEIEIIENEAEDEEKSLLGLILKMGTARSGNWRHTSKSRKGKKGGSDPENRVGYLKRMAEMARGKPSAAKRAKNTKSAKEFVKKNPNYAFVKQSIVKVRDEKTGRLIDGIEKTVNGKPIPKWLEKSTKPIPNDWIRETKFDKNGDKIPDPLKKNKLIPNPATWTDVHINLNEKDCLTVPKGKKRAAPTIRGYDRKGEPGAGYHKDTDMDVDVAKHDRNGVLDKYADKVSNVINKHLRSRDTVVAASCLSLIAITGMRPEKDADKKAMLAKSFAYGATTLEGRHVSIATDKKHRGKLHIQFIGKKGVENNYYIDAKDPVAKDVLSRAKRAGSKGRLYPDLGYPQFLAFTKQVGKEAGIKKVTITPKDFRTLASNRIIKKEKAKYPVPKTWKQKRQYMDEIFTSASIQLNNKPKQIEKSYADMRFFEDWSHITQPEKKKKGTVLLRRRAGK